MSAVAPDRPSPRQSEPSAGRFFAYRWAVGLSVGVLQSLLYFAVGHFQRPRSTTLLELPLDRGLPFWVWTVWLYLPFYAGIFAMAISGLRRRALFNRALKGVLFTMFLGTVGHLLIAAEYPRPAVTPPYDGASEAFLAWVQAVDPPGNVFPSLHVAHTSALALILRADRPVLGTVAMVMALLLALSTLTTKQHFLLDVLSGWAIAFAVSHWVLRPFRR
jgi:membrane-associated phospholipid phosphatase